jgi:hypothetical protein
LRHTSFDAVEVRDHLRRRPSEPAAFGNEQAGNLAGLPAADFEAYVTIWHDVENRPARRR